MLADCFRICRRYFVLVYNGLALSVLLKMISGFLELRVTKLATTRATPVTTGRYALGLPMSHPLMYG